MNESEKKDVVDKPEENIFELQKPASRESPRKTKFYEALQTATQKLVAEGLSAYEIWKKENNYDPDD